MRNFKQTMEKSKEFDASLLLSTNQLRTQERYQNLRENELTDVMQKRLAKFYGGIEHINVSK